MNLGLDHGPRDAAVREPVRLVVWDLDETFWRGTLTEGGITEHLTEAEAAVRQLAQRGIVSSICSKNDHRAVEAVLVGRGLWDFFVFPSIDWSAKGPRVKAIVEAVQLRPETVLFIDDSATNRAEVAAAVPGIRVIDERAVVALLGDPLLAGKEDRDLSRLQHYRLLERRGRERRRQAGDGREFLRASAIRVEIDHDVEVHLDRAVEIVNRTNQLNFTKVRLPEDRDAAREALRAQLHATSGRRAAVVKVSDRFGDHGIVGFWMMDGIWVEPYLIHFAFSCRILGLGVEQWVYERLGRPRLDVVGDVVATLDASPDWINKLDLTGGGEPTAIASPRRVRLRGGCELEVLRHFFAFSTPHVSSEFVFPRDGQTVWASHVATLFDQPGACTQEGAAALADIGFRSDDLASSFLAAAEESACLVLSNSADSQVPLFRHRALGITVPVKLFGIDLTRPVDEGAVADFCDANGLAGERAAAFNGWVSTLVRNWEHVPFAAIDWPAQYDRLARAVPAGSLLVLILPLTFANTADGGTVEFPEQATVNGLLRDLASRFPNVSVVDTAECVRSRDELRKLSHLHFARDVYHRLYRRILKVHADWRVGREEGAVYTPDIIG
ncbi:HAD-IIIC family phosphatase [Lichenibacterium minor]|uniref:HAD-IIIC family phosphatase n=1 Tax=Lichenibacterium minor TaxID=2316528 RepID=A0A4V1RU58_9HYPH|nr:HAD-IIIC family phosphatase [Lichenibacterium minor]RYC30004.1 HAD-IIIC family phosphatase [Lichenibacterium minor]